MALGWRGQYYRYKELFLNIAAVYKRRADVRMFLEIILSLSTVTIFLIFALKPTVITIISLVKEIDEKQNSIATLDKKIQDLNTARNIYSQEASSVSLIESAIPINPDIQVIVGQIQGMASKNSVSLRGFSTGEIVIIGTSQKKKSASDNKPLPGDSKEIPVSITISGDYQNINSFLNDLENFRRQLKIDTLGINSSETAQGKSIVAIITGRFPYLGEK
jgi:Tfp pilus assembly protein PilO